jgi:hypothetical protein
MSITITARPRTSQQAAYNPIVYEFDSTQKNQPGFRYIVELFNLFTGQKITEFRIAPAPVHGRGYVDVSKILSNFVDKSLQFQSVYNATNSTMINYSARFGEEFQLNWVFNDYIFSAGSIALTTDSAFGPGFSNQTHSFSVGDQIFIQMNTTYNDNRDNLNGYFTVTEILSPMHLTQFGYAHAYDNNNNNAFWMYVENSEGEVFRKIISTGGTSLVRGFSYGPGNIGTLIPVTGVLPLIKPATKWYKFWTANGADVRTSKEYTINVDRRCLIEPIQILFMDRKGSWSTFMFDLRQKRRLTTEKKSYRKEFGRIQTGSPTNWATFDKTDQGLINYTSRGQLKYELNTNWLDDSENMYFEQLLTSPYTYVNFGDGAWKACIVEDGQFETELQRNRRLIRRTISITPAIEDPINI